jgi:hypothetical protein
MTLGLPASLRGPALGSCASFSVFVEHQDQRRSSNLAMLRPLHLVVILPFGQSLATGTVLPLDAQRDRFAIEDGSFIPLPSEGCRHCLGEGSVIRGEDAVDA